MKIRDLDSLRPLVVSLLRSDATSQGPLLSYSRIIMDLQYSLYVDMEYLRLSLIMETLRYHCVQISPLWFASLRSEEVVMEKSA